MPKNLGVDTFPDPFGHFGPPWRPFLILEAVRRCRRWASAPFAARLVFANRYGWEGWEGHEGEFWNVIFNQTGLALVDQMIKYQTRLYVIILLPLYITFWYSSSLGSYPPDYIDQECLYSCCQKCDHPRIFQYFVQGSFDFVWKVLWDRFMCVSYVFHACFMHVSCVLHVRFMGISCVFHVCFIN